MNHKGLTNPDVCRPLERQRRIHRMLALQAKLTDDPVVLCCCGVFTANTPFPQLRTPGFSIAPVRQSVMLRYCDAMMGNKRPRHDGRPHLARAGCLIRAISMVSGTAPRSRRGGAVAHPIRFIGMDGGWMARFRRLGRRIRIVGVVTVKMAAGTLPYGRVSLSGPARSLIPTYVGTSRYESRQRAVLFFPPCAYSPGT
jgi:hypothetical protein